MAADLDETRARTARYLAGDLPLWMTGTPGQPLWQAGAPTL